MYCYSVQYCSLKGRITGKLLNKSNRTTPEVEFLVSGCVAWQSGAPTPLVDNIPQSGTKNLASAIYPSAFFVHVHVQLYISVCYLLKGRLTQPMVLAASIGLYPSLQAHRPVKLVCNKERVSKSYTAKNVRFMYSQKRNCAA